MDERGSAVSVIDHHEQDRAFLAWVRNPETLAADLRASWACHDADENPVTLPWRLRAIERELARRNESILPVPAYVLR